MSIDDNKKLVRRFWEQTWNEANLAVLDELFEPALAQQHSAFISRTLSAFSDSHVTIEDEIAEGDRVVVRYSWRAVHTGVWDVALSAFPMQVPPTAKAVWDRGIGIFRISDGKIVENWLEWTKLELAQQLGAIESANQLLADAPRP